MSVALVIVMWHVIALLHVDSDYTKDSHLPHEQIWEVPQFSSHSRVPAVSGPISFSWRMIVSLHHVFSRHDAFQATLWLILI